MKKKIRLFALALISSLWLSAGIIVLAADSTSCNHKYESRGQTTGNWQTTHKVNGETCTITWVASQSYQYCVLCGDKTGPTDHLDGFHSLKH